MGNVLLAVEEKSIALHIAGLNFYLEEYGCFMLTCNVCSHRRTRRKRNTASFIARVSWQ